MTKRLYWDSSRLSDHLFIRETFCNYCKLKKGTDCKDFIYSNGVCIAFQWRSDKILERYKNEVLEMQAFVIHLNRGIPSEVINKMDKKKLLSVLTDKHYNYFERRIEEDRQQTEEIKKLKELGFTCSEDYYKTIEPKKPAPPKKNKQQKVTVLPTHYFYVKSPDGTIKVFKRGKAGKAYEQDVRYLRKYIEDNNFIIIKEEIK